MEVTCYRLCIALLVKSLERDSKILGRCRRHSCGIINVLWVMSLECKEDVDDIQGTCLLDVYIDVVNVGTLWVFGKYMGVRCFLSPAATVISSK
jgi:hypothetical protein